MQMEEKIYAENLLSVYAKESLSEVVLMIEPHELSNILITVDFLINLFNVLQGLPQLEKIHLVLETFNGDET